VNELNVIWISSSHIATDEVIFWKKWFLTFLSSSRSNVAIEKSLLKFAVPEILLMFAHDFSKNSESSFENVFSTSSAMSFGKL
jgi:hypothetical protein